MFKRKDKDTVTREEFRGMQESIDLLSANLNFLASVVGVTLPDTIYAYVGNPRKIGPTVDRLSQDFNLLIEHLGVAYFDYPTTRQIRQTKKENKK
jgi:hypothetical protein